MTDLSNVSVRPITGPEELDLFCTLTYTLDDELADDLADGHRRAQWMWLALRDERVVARAAFWADPEAATPSLLDVLDVADEPDRVELGVHLLKAMLGKVFPADGRPEEYIRFIPPDWRDEPGSRRVVEDRMAIAEQTGAKLLVERLRFEWRPGLPVPESTCRLTFRPPDGDGELVDLMTLVMDGTLDAHGQADLARMPARQAAISHFRGELARYSSPRSWWRIATRPDGVPVGFVTPARNDYGAIMAYLGVLPEHRGNGYIDDILAEGTRILTATNVPRIRASTDLGNVPMAEAFRRAGWVNFERAITMTWA